MIKENSWSLGKGSYQYFIHTHYIYNIYVYYIYIICFTGKFFQGLQKSMWLVVTECLWRNCIFIFFFTFELLYSLTIESWDGTFLWLKKGSWDPLNLHTQFFEYCNKKKYHDKAVCLCFGRPDSLGKGQLQGSQETHRKREMACWVQCLLPRHEDLSSEPPHPQKVKCRSH